MIFVIAVNEEHAKSPFSRVWSRPFRCPFDAICSTTMSATTFESVVEEEVRRLEVVHPTPDDIPGCMRLLDDFLSCHGALGTTSLSTGRSDLNELHSSRIAVEVAV